MSTLSTGTTGASMRSSGSRVSTLTRVISVIEMVVQRRRSRIALLEMSEAQLKDIGISRSDAYREASRPFWG